QKKTRTHPIASRLARAALCRDLFIRSFCDSGASLSLEFAIRMQLSLSILCTSLGAIHRSQQEMDRRFVGAVLHREQKVRQGFAGTVQLDEGTRSVHAGLH